MELHNDIHRARACLAPELRRQLFILGGSHRHQAEYNDYERGFEFHSGFVLLLQPFPCKRRTRMEIH
jgi:hypothetical protein